MVRIIRIDTAANRIIVRSGCIMDQLILPTRPKPTSKTKVALRHLFRSHHTQWRGGGIKEYVRKIEQVLILQGSDSGFYFRKAFHGTLPHSDAQIGSSFQHSARLARRVYPAYDLKQRSVRWQLKPDAGPCQPPVIADYYDPKVVRD